jgi:8-oxo-dGTP diphosphatase
MPAARNADFPVCGFTGLSSPVHLRSREIVPGARRNEGDWKVARTRRLESLRYQFRHRAAAVLAVNASLSAMSGDISESKPRIEVAAGLVFGEGRLLITQRPAGGHLAGLWEFPGGKRHADETFPQCLSRELREELGIEVEIGECFERITHEYPEKIVHLEFFLCRWLRHEPQALGCPAFAWVLAPDLDRYQFPAADARLLKRLARTPSLWQPPPSGS